MITVGYPFIIPEDATNCTYGSLLGFGTITHDDLAWLREEVLEKLNEVIQAVSADHGATYVDLYESGRGHDVCAKPAARAWVEGLLAKLIPLEHALVHPNAAGHANAAKYVEDAMLRVLAP